MNSKQTTRVSAPLIFLFSFLNGVSLATAGGQTSFYLDSRWTGNQTGAQSQPWQSLTSVAWAAINRVLLTNDVVVFFTARSQSGESVIYDANRDGIQDGIDINMRTAVTGFKLTMDGRSVYNANASSPSWQPNDTATRSTVRYVNSQNSRHVKSSNIKITGFRILCDTVSIAKFVAISGDNWEVSDCDMSHTSAAKNGPGLLIVPTCDSAHGGSSEYTMPCTNIVIRNNFIHDTYGEVLYVGGGGLNPGEPGSGYPSHRDILIEGNKIYNGAVWGAQGDGIDLKGGLENVIIRGNEIYNLAGNASSPVRAIVMQGQPEGGAQTTIIERNYIHDCTGIEDAAIAIVNSWGIPQGIVIRNNVIGRIKGPSVAAGIKIYASQDMSVLHNNTIFECSSFAVITDSGSQTQLINNLVYSNGVSNVQVSLKGTIDSDNNAFLSVWGYPSEGSNSILLSTLDLSAFLMDVTNGDVRVKFGSRITSKGRQLTDFSTDISGRNRGTKWDIGAWNYSWPLRPANLRVVQ